MNVQQILGKALDALTSKRLDKAIELLEQIFEERPTLMGKEAFESVKADYELMIDFMRRGFNDPQRATLHLTLLQRLYRVVADLEISWRCKNIKSYVSSFLLSDRLNMRHDFIRTVLESYVSDLAMLSLSTEPANSQKAKEIADNHEQFMGRLFHSIWISCQWTEADCNFYTALLTSPTIVVADQQLITSAIMLGAMNVFDINKFKTLTNVYQQATEELVKQRALVGWVFSVWENMNIFPEQTKIIQAMCKDTRTVQELLYLQEQLFNSNDAEADNNKIQREIMPDLIKGSNLKWDGRNITEKENDPLQDIFNQNDEEKQMEVMDEKLQKMKDMQKKGSDIYFGSFRAMKNFPFFNFIQNWFMPFYTEHSSLRDAIQRLGSENYIKVITQKGAFCDSDKYSFSFTLAEVFRQLPENLKEMVTAESMMGPFAINEDAQNVNIIRREYIQDLYRFYKLSPFGRDLMNPYQDNGLGDYAADIFFFSYTAFMGSGLDEMKMRLGFFLHSHGKMKELAELMVTFHSEEPDYYLLQGLATLGTGNPLRSYFFFDKILDKDPENVNALKGKAQAALMEKDYETIAEVNETLHKLFPNVTSYNFHRCGALLKLGRGDEVREEMFKMEFENPFDNNCKRLLAWAMLTEGSLEKATKLYEELTKIDMTLENFVNAGYCQWAVGKVDEAASYFRQWMKIGEKTEDDLLDTFIEDCEVLRKYGISEVDELLMLSIIKA